MIQSVATETGRRYSVVGAGAIGGTLAWHLAQAGHHLSLIDIDRKHIQRIIERGLVIERDGRSPKRSASRRSRRRSSPAP